MQLEFENAFKLVKLLRQSFIHNLRVDFNYSMEIKLAQLKI